MGRTPINMRLRDDLVARVDAVAGLRGRTAFFERAAEMLLAAEGASAPVVERPVAAFTPLPTGRVSRADLFRRATQRR